MELLVPKRTKTERTLRVGFVVGAYPSEDHVRKAAHVAWDKFLRDMAKQDWTYMGGEVEFEGPMPHIPLRTLPSVSEQAKRHPSEFIAEVPTLETAEHWIYFLSAKFWRELPWAEFLVTSPGEMPVDYPDEIKRKIV